MGEKEGMITVVIPCYNEVDTIGDIVARAGRHADEVIVADDGSTDGTAFVAREAGAKVVRSNKRQGFGRNVMTGISCALSNGKADIVVTLDGDGQHDPDEIPCVVEYVRQDEADMVIGARFLEKHKIPVYRKCGIKVITWLYNVGHKRKINDAQSCFRAYRRELLEALTFEDGTFGFSTEILVKARKAGFRIREVPIRCIYHRDIRMNSTMNPVAQGVSVAVSTVWWRLRRR